MRDLPLPLSSLQLAQKVYDPDNYVSVFVDRIQQFVRSTEETLKPTEQLQISAILPDDKSVIVDHLGYHNPNLVSITTREADGSARFLLVHQHSLQLLCAIEEVGAGRPRRSIGFDHPQREAPG